MFNCRVASHQNFLAMRFDASACPEKVVCHLQGLVKTSVTVDALLFGQIWFRSVIAYEFGGQAYSRTELRESICRPLLEWLRRKNKLQWLMGKTGYNN